MRFQNKSYRIPRLQYSGRQYIAPMWKTIAYGHSNGDLDQAAAAAAVFHPYLAIAYSAPRIISHGVKGASSAGGAATVFIADNMIAKQALALDSGSGCN